MFFKAFFAFRANQETLYSVCSFFEDYLYLFFHHAILGDTLSSFSSLNLLFPPPSQYLFSLSPLLKLHTHIAALCCTAPVCSLLFKLMKLPHLPRSLTLLCLLLTASVFPATPGFNLFIHNLSFSLSLPSSSSYIIPSLPPVC